MSISPLDLTTLLFRRSRLPLASVNLLLAPCSRTSSCSWAASPCQRSSYQARCATTSARTGGPALSSMQDPQGRARQLVRITLKEESFFREIPLFKLCFVGNLIQFFFSCFKNAFVRVLNCCFWVNLRERGGTDGVFQVLAGLLEGIS